MFKHTILQNKIMAYNKHYETSMAHKEVQISNVVI